MDLRFLRNWFLYGAVTLIVVVAGVYLERRWSHATAAHPVAPEKLGGVVERATSGFSLSKAEGGRTLFTIHAAQAVEYRAGEPTRLHDVNIVVFGRNGDRYDQISGSDFEYDPASGDARALGAVQIDLEGNPSGGETPPREQKNLIHVRTSDLEFNQKSGISRTSRPVSFRMSQATGSAVGARWDSAAGALTLNSNVVVNTTGPNPWTLSGASAVFTRAPRQLMLEKAALTQPGRQMTAARVTAFLDDQNRIQKILAAGDVRSVVETTVSAVNARARATSEAEHYESHSPSAEFLFSGKGKLETAVLRDVTLSASGARIASGSAKTAQVFFDINQQVSKIHAAGDVHLLQPPASAAEGNRQSMELIADALDLYAAAGRRLTSAATDGAARIEILPQPTRSQPAPEKTTITAARFHAQFDRTGKLRMLTGEPQAKIISPVAKQPPRVSTSDRVQAQFDSQGGITALVQHGNVHFDDGQRQAFGETARYAAASEILVLTGSPRVTEADGNTTADRIQFNRVTGEAVAEGNVKSTYIGSKPASGGALLGSSSPVHVTAARMQAERGSGAAGDIVRYFGAARLWQDANIVQASEIDFDRNARSMTAQSADAHPVESVLTQRGASGKETPVKITAQKLVYSDALRRADYQGHVVMTSQDGGLSSNRLEVYLKPRASAPAAASAPSHIDHAVAGGNVVLTQPGRTGEGDQLVYTDSDQKFVLTGAPNALPQVIDSARGLTRGNVLVFFRGQDRIIVEGSAGERAYTETSVK